MALEALNSPASMTPSLKMPRRFDDFEPLSLDTWRKSKRSKRNNHHRPTTESDDEYLAACLVMLSHSHPTPTTSQFKKDENSPTSSVIKKDQETFLETSTVIKKDQETSPEVPPPQNPYRCSVCDKGFSSYQALGGHKASHRAKPPPSDGGAAAAAPASYVSALNPSGRLHECSVCGKSFPTGQALGGHKRRHYEGVIGGAAKSRTTTTSSNGGGGAVDRGFDLNMLPSPEELRCDEEVESSAVPPPSFVGLN